MGEMNICILYSPMEEIIIYTTIFCLMINFMLGKLRLLSLVWLYNMQKRNLPTSKADEPIMGISVIICTRNDLENLKTNLPSVLQQNYPEFEVIVVNDASQDGTIVYLEELSGKHAHLRMVNIENKIFPGKKYALKKGIEQAKYPFVALTDADCTPATNGWLENYARYAGEQKIVLGYGPYKKKKGFLNAFIRFDTVMIAIQYMSKALWKYPYMGVGRNMGYAKDLLSAHAQVDATIASGDDDLFVQAVSKRAKFMVMLEKESFTLSTPQQTWGTWMNQKGRHATTAPKYKWSVMFGLMVQWLASAGFYLGVICILLTGNFQTGLMLLFLNLLCLGLFNGLWISKLGEKDLILSAPFLDFIYTFVQPIFVLKSWGRKKDRWN
jgi:cellulose synthase/poly-beta-1,6-N-acetylglucosamine synthase-like glycosyltransferase